MADDSETFKKLKTFFVEFLGAANIFDLSNFIGLVLHLSYMEFEQRFLASAISDPEKLCSIKKSNKWNRQIRNLPILSSECPGWV